ncbi:zinc finger protein 511 lethal (2) k10201 [Oratosquilla oratoria]|uniref:zinc finger protein 511 lethal (2) k10201 n=1 Tax=Oratosquilla oratoria TaxID=337810 RepID=UPI003F7765A6
MTLEMRDETVGSPWSYVLSLGLRHFHKDDPLFAAGDGVCIQLMKYPYTDIDEEGFFGDKKTQIACRVFGCTQVFTSMAEHAKHTKTCHAHTCNSCGQVLPSHHLLDIHISENHDSFFKTMSEKEPMYTCLQESCSEKFQTPTERKAHCISVHCFPPSFRFDKTWKDLPLTGKKLRNKAKRESDEVSSVEGKDIAVDEMLTPDVTDQDSAEMEIDAINSSSREKGANTLVPSSISFGFGVKRGFIRGYHGNSGQFRKKRGQKEHWYQGKKTSSTAQMNIEEIDMNELEEALPVT